MLSVFGESIWLFVLLGSPHSTSYLKGQRDLVSRLVITITHAVKPVF